ncbi:acetylornithine aminotransferase [Parafrankia colletiae]|uniref:Acetylornithine aminotransferase n=1 Tax=Parafrankia colletiae TaxID=573497 RepID=A0A1S1QGQ4_9ACTN|nr:aminotransferase class III-fold pyridoxal phosphate-dependent enzyme [Parafrankia colletiae]MCK9902323.1 aminotransferase class III-fold pyridoxal phosphate-dependent enzyme [Frankia sp. Cpl3]OHV33140.1 acetylornithine aminotransferase [Parafrankia colletiae]
MTTVTQPPTNIAGPESPAQTLRRYRQHLSKGRAVVAEMFGSHMEMASSGAWLWTSAGERFLNCGGYGVLTLGARHPTVLAEVRNQLDAHPIATRILLEPTVGRAAEALASVVPPSLNRMHFALSGAEAVETGLKLARANGRRRLVSMHLGYHGKTLGALSVTAKEVYQEPFRPLLPDVTHIPFGDLPALEAELAAHPGEVCVIVEPVQGEGGVILPPPGYLPGVEALCREYGGFLILDEVQTGMGRLGAWWGADLYGVLPDVLLTGKALGGGVLPVCAALANRRTFSVFDKDPYRHTGTFTGAPVLMAAVVGAIRATKEEDVPARAASLGARLLSALTEIVNRKLPGLVVEVRGQGLLIGIEFAEAGLAGEFLIELFNNRVVANHSMNGSSVVRLTPPAILDDAQVDFLLAAFEQATDDLLAHGATMPEGL